MGLQIIREKPAMSEFIADRRLYLTADRERVVEHGDPEAAILFAAEGSPIAQEDAERYGLEATPAPVDAEAEPDGEPAPAPRARRR
jgi:hypothetical protein